MVDIVFPLFIVALVVYAVLAICFRNWRSVIATVMAIVVPLSIGILMLIHAQDKEVKPLPRITNSRPMG